MFYRADTAVGCKNLSLTFFMKIFRVLGLALAIIMLRFLVPNIFRALEHTFLTLFNTLDFILSKAQTGSNEASLINLLPH